MKLSIAIFFTVLIGLGTAFDSLSCLVACQIEQETIAQTHVSYSTSGAEEPDTDRSGSHCHFGSCTHTQFFAKVPVTHFIGQNPSADFFEIQFLYQSPVTGNLKRPPIA